MDLLSSINSAGGEARTPPRSTDAMRDLRSHSFDDSVVIENTQSRAAEQFDLVATKVNDTIQEIKSVYSEIGYSQEEIGAKKNEIFEAIRETISTFTQNLQHEKTSIQNECDWLRQQVHLIFSVLNEDRGEKVLSLTDRWLLFKDDPQLQQDIAAENSKWQLAKDSHMLLPQPSQFSYSSHLIGGSGKDFSTLKGWKEPEYSLLEVKSRLNFIFLEALKTFVKVFRRFNELNVAFWENIDLIVEDWAPDLNDTFLCSIPNKAAAHAHAKLIKDFDDMLGDLKLEQRIDHRAKISESKNDNYAFIISSPRKRNSSRLESQSSSGRHLSFEDEMSRLRDINYSIVRTIRSLKVSKFNSAVLTNMRKAVENTDEEISKRVAHIREKLRLCLDLADALSLGKNDVITILKESGLSTPGLNLLVSREGQIEVETLHFILENPHELGLKDQHINFISKLLNTLQDIKKSKEQRLEFLKLACKRLWETLNESNDYVEMFLERNDNLTDEAIYNFEHELRRLQEKRREFIEEFIGSTREEIEKFHGLLFHTISQRQSFKYYELDLSFTTDDKERILTDHEEELERLKKEYQSKHKILDLYLELKDLLENQKFLIESSKNSKRLLEKNSCQTLLNEERIRKRVQRIMPRVLSALKKEILAYNNELISKGGKAINIGDADLFEEVLMIESDSDNLNVSKSTRSRPVKEAPKSVSPVKSRASSRPISPIKQRSPQKVTKPLNHRSTLSPIKSDRQKVAIAKYTNSLAGGSGIPRLSSQDNRHQTSKTLCFKSPPLKPRDHFNIQSSPRQISNASSSSSSSGRSNSSQLHSLNEPLPPDTSAYNSVFSDARESSTLYSTCSRLSPLRGDSLSNVRQSNFAGKPVIHHEIDKENVNVMAGGSVDDDSFALSPVRFNNSYKNTDSHISRLSTNSLANSTILGDDYQTWRDERIKELNGSQ